MSVAKVYFWLTLHYHEHVTAEDMSSVAKMSYSELKTQFEKTYSIDVWEFLRKLRLSNARYLLVYTPFSIREIARRVGYSYICLEQNFMTAFHMTPAEFRTEFQLDQTKLFDDMI